MKIKRSSKGGVVLSSNDASVELLADSNSISIQVKSKENDVAITSPGEYEYGGIGVTAIEITENGYVGKINLVQCQVDNVVVLFAPIDVTIKKEDKDALSGANILIPQGITIKTLKHLIDSVDPDHVVLNSDKSEAFTKLISSLNKEFGISDIAKESKLTYKSYDFETEEDVALTFTELE